MRDQAKGGILSPFLQKQRIRAALPFLKTPVLDFGCGGGALAKHFPPDLYLGVEPDGDILQAARADWPQHQFLSALPVGRSFAGIACLAVLEHLEDPPGTLTRLRAMLAPGGVLVLTTPHPSFIRLHELGAAILLCSPEARDEHKAFFHRGQLEALGRSAAMRITHYRRFLGGLNQLCVLKRQED